MLLVIKFCKHQLFFCASQFQNAPWPCKYNIKLSVVSQSSLTLSILECVSSWGGGFGNQTVMCFYSIVPWIYLWEVFVFSLLFLWEWMQWRLFLLQWRQWHSTQTYRVSVWVDRYTGLLSVSEKTGSQKRATLHHTGNVW